MHKTTTLKHNLRYNNIGSRATNIRIGIPRIVTAFQFQRGLNNGTLTDLPFLSQIFAHGNNFSTHFVTDDNRDLGNIVRNSLVRCSLFYRFVGRLTEGVGNHTHQDFIRRNFWQFKFLGAQIHRAVHTDSFCFHKFSP